MSFLNRFFRLLLVLVVMVVVSASSLAFMGPRVADLVSAHRSDHERISLDPLAERSLMFDSAGNLQGTMTNRDDPQNRSQVPLSKVPDTVKLSVLAAEDADFYEHNGVNVRSILRAVDANIESGGVAQGGSTITQQVVKNTLVGDEQDLSRKLREAFLAVELEKQMDKDEILEYYLNGVYLGGGAYGVQAASEYYFQKSVETLNWAEGALLAALIRSPSYYDPFRNPDVAERRRSIVFGRLVAEGELTEEEVAFSETVPLPTTPNRPKPVYDYFQEEVKQALLTDPGYGLGATEAARNRAVFEGGIRVYTTFDPSLQLQAVQASSETLPNHNGDLTFTVDDPRSAEDTFGTQAIVSVQPDTGAVRAMVGGPGFERWQYNLATAGRQPGSTMKTFVLAALFENDFVPADKVNGGSCTFKFPSQREPYSPSTSSRVGYGTITKMTQASSNCGFVRLGQAVGIDKVVDLARRLGVKGELDAVPSLPLGTSDVSPLEMASAYATFANDGVHHEPYMVERIEDRNGKVLYQHQSTGEQVVSVQTARLVNQVLQANVTSGTGTRAKIANGQPAAGKTGTTNDSTDVWFVGYTPQLSTAVWMGAPKGNISLANAGLGGATGGRYPAATWGRYNSLVFADRPKVEFVEPESERAGKSIPRTEYEVGGGSRRSSRGGGD